MTLTQQIVIDRGRPASTRVGTILSVNPLQVSIQGSVLDAESVGVIASYSPVAGDSVVMLGQSAVTARAGSWLILGRSSSTPFFPPSVKAFHSTLINLPNNTATLIPLQTEAWKSDTSMHSNIVNNSRLIAPIDGRYLVIGMIGFVSNSTGRRIIQIGQNSGGVSAAGTRLIENVEMTNPNGSHSVPAIIETLMRATDYVEMFASQFSGGNLNTDPISFHSFMSLSWQGPYVE